VDLLADIGRDSRACKGRLVAKVDEVVSTFADQLGAKAYSMLPPASQPLRVWRSLQHCDDPPLSTAMTRDICP
jgi:hypothetical protein